MVAMDRRKMLGALGGAAIAAPTVAKGVAAQMADYSSSKKIGIPMGYGLGGSAQTSTSEGANWLQQRLKGLVEEMASFKTENRPLCERSWHPVIAQQIDSLRSVSGQNKARMMVERTERLAAEAHKSYLEREIADLKAKLGPLAGLL